MRVILDAKSNRAFQRPLAHSPTGIICACQGKVETSGCSQSRATSDPVLQRATDEGGNTLSGVVSLTFSLYSSQQSGEPLWTETQNNVQLNSTGHYSVQLGITKPNGVPTTLFTSGEVRWLGVRIAEQAEQPHVSPKASLTGL
jgi:hypothetical protein